MAGHCFTGAILGAAELAVSERGKQYPLGTSELGLGLGRGCCTAVLCGSICISPCHDAEKVFVFCAASCTHRVNISLIIPARNQRLATVAATSLETTFNASYNNAHRRKRQKQSHWGYQRVVSKEELASYSIW